MQLLHWQHHNERKRDRMVWVHWKHCQGVKVTFRVWWRHSWPTQIERHTSRPGCRIFYTAWSRLCHQYIIARTPPTGGVLLGRGIGGCALWTVLSCSPQKVWRFPQVIHAVWPRSFCRRCDVRSSPQLVKSGFHLYSYNVHYGVIHRNHRVNFWWDNTAYCRPIWKHQPRTWKCPGCHWVLFQCLLIMSLDPFIKGVVTRWRPGKYVQKKRMRKWGERGTFCESQLL